VARNTRREAFSSCCLRLTDIDGFSHLFVLWLFDRVEGFDLLATPPTDTQQHGVFATRSPRRPNPIGLTVVRLLGRDGCRLRVAMGDSGNAGAGNYHLHFSIALISDPQHYWEGVNLNPYPLLKK
jgi:tRNA-methyltransferase O